MEEKMMIFGIRPLIEAIEAGRDVDKVLVQKGISGDLFKQLRQTLETTGTPMQFVPVQKLNQYTRDNHQGIIAFLSAVKFYDLENMINIDLAAGKKPVYALADGITDVRNFGAIARSAECFGINGIILPSSGSARVNADAVKTSAGALLKIPISRVTNTVDAIHLLKQCGFEIISFSEKSDSAIGSFPMKTPCVVIFGSEEKGVSKMAIKLSDNILKINMSGTTGSLNVSVAAGIVFHEIAKNR